MLLSTIVVLVVLGIAVAAITRSLLALVPPALIPIVYIGIDQGWWGMATDLGDRWQAAAVIVTGGSLLLVAAITALARTVRPRRRAP